MSALTPKADIPCTSAIPLSIRPGSRRLRLWRMTPDARLCLQKTWPLIFASSVSVLAIGTFIFVAVLRTGLSVLRLSIDQERLLRRLAGIVLGVLFLGSLVAGVDLLTRIAA